METNNEKLDLKNQNDQKNDKKEDQNDKEDQEKQLTTYDVEMRKLDIKEKKEEEYKKFKEENKNKIISLVLGVITIASLFDYGFFRTLGIWIVLGFCYCLGGWRDKDPKVKKFVVNLLKKFQ